MRQHVVPTLFVDGERGLEHGTDHAFLPPYFAGLQFPVRKQARELGAGPGAARRAVVGETGAKDEIAAIQLRSGRRTENFDVIDLRAVGSTKAGRLQRLPHLAGEGRKRRGIVRGDTKAAGFDQEEPVAAPCDVADDLAVARNVQLYFCGKSVAWHVADGHARAIVQGRRHDADAGLDAMRSHADPAQVRKRDDETDSPVTAHADRPDVVEKNHPRHASSIVRLAQQRPDQNIRPSRLVDDARSIAIANSPEARQTPSEAATAKIRAAIDHYPSGLSRSVRIDNPHLFDTHAASSSVDLCTRPVRLDRIRYNILSRGDSSTVIPAKAG